MVIGNYDFQIRLASIIVNDKIFVGGIYDVLDFDYFDNAELKVVIRFVINYYKKYFTIPTKTVLADWLEDFDDEDEQTLVLKKIEEILEIFDGERSDFEYIKDKTIKFVEKQEVIKSVQKMLDGVDSSEYNFDKFRHEIALTGGIGKGGDVGSEYVETLDRRYFDNERDPIPTFSKVLDKYFDGGLGAGELGVIQAPTNIGKSFALIYMTAKAMTLRKNVLYLSLEMEEDYVNKRVDARLCDIKLGEQKENIEAIREEIIKYKGLLYTKRLSEDGTSSNTIRAFLKKLETKKEFSPDLIVLDYADLMTSNLKAESNHLSVSQTYKEIRAIAHDFGIPIWTAGQVDTEGSKLDFIENNNASGAKGKINHVDVAFSISRTADDVEHNVAKCYISKNRNGGSKIKLMADMDLENSILNIYDCDSEDGQRIMKKMKENYNMALGNIVKKFKQSSKERKGVS